MKKLLLIAIAGLVAASSSWGLSFNWQNGGPDASTAVKLVQNGRATGGDPARFIGVNGAIVDPVEHGAPGLALGDFISIFSIESIRNSATNLTYFDATDPYQIVGVLYGLTDAAATDGTGSPDFVNVFSTGGRLELYLVPDSPAFMTPDPAFIGVDGGDGTITYPGVTDGIPFVAFDLVSRSNGFTDQRQINIIDPAQQANNQGGFFADVDASWDNYLTYGKAFDTNTISSIADGVSGADLQVDYVMNVLGGADALPLAFDGPQFGAIQPVPEPSTLLLLGTGLLGMVGYARRRRS